MKIISFVFLYLIIELPIMAGQFDIKKENVFSDNRPGNVRYSIKNDSCRITFETNYSVGKDGQVFKFIGKKEKCSRDVTLEYRLSLYKEIISEIFDSDYFKADKEINVYWGSTDFTPALNCRLINYASNSHEWMILADKLGNKPVEYHEMNPYPVELGQFIQKSGLLKEVELIFNEYKFKLKAIKVGAFITENIKDLDNHERNCFKGISNITIVPTGAELYLVFELID